MLSQTEGRRKKINEHKQKRVDTFFKRKFRRKMDLIYNAEKPQELGKNTTKTPIFIQFPQKSEGDESRFVDMSHGAKT